MAGLSPCCAAVISYDLINFVFDITCKEIKFMCLVLTVSFTQST